MCGEMQTWTHGCACGCDNRCLIAQPGLRWGVKRWRARGPASSEETETKVPAWYLSSTPQMWTLMSLTTCSWWAFVSQLGG